MTRIFLIRHGKPRAQWGDPDLDPGLDVEGEAQAEYAARTLLRLPSGSRPGRVVSSPLRRCLETARPLADALGVTVEIVPEVGEIPTPSALDPSARGPWLRQALQGRWSAVRGDIDYDQWRGTVASAVRARPGAAIFSHFVAINAVISVLRGEDTVSVFRPAYASITELEEVGDDLRLKKLGSEAATAVL